MRVEFQNDDRHKAQPKHYPQVGTIGEAFFIDEDQDELCVQWPPHTTSLDDCWYCDSVDVRILPEGSADAEVTSESGGNIVHCFECRYYGGGETCRCNHPQLCFGQGWSEESFEEPQFPCENFEKIRHCVSGENLKGLMLWKDDFKHQRDWVAICKALDLPETTTTIELGCVVRVHKY